MKKIFILIRFVAIGLLFLATNTRTSAAQESPSLVLTLSRDFGYGGFAGDIQGAFSMHVKDPPDLVRVVFLIDGQPIGEATGSPPFRLAFNTGDYPYGKHTLSAIGYTADGRELQSNEIVREFVSADRGFQGAMEIVLPLLGIILVAGLIAWGIPALFMRGKVKKLPAGAARSYSPLGGAICPKCGRPFAMHMYGLNVMVGKYDRCPYCGRWSLVRRASLDALREAEAAEVVEADTSLIPEVDEAEKLRKEIDSSRYQDL